jgi:hypothetical protein
MATIVLNSIATPPRSSVIGSRSSTTAMASSPGHFIEMPKSPCRALPMNFRYWMWIG